MHLGNKLKNYIDIDFQTTHCPTFVYLKRPIPLCKRVLVDGHLKQLRTMLRFDDHGSENNDNESDENEDGNDEEDDTTTNETSKRKL